MVILRRQQISSYLAVRRTVVNDISATSNVKYDSRANSIESAMKMRRDGQIKECLLFNDKWDSFVTSHQMDF